jgi:hypothetical protein
MRNKQISVSPWRGLGLIMQAGVVMRHGKAAVGPGVAEERELLS